MSLTTGNNSSPDERILILAPLGQDAALAAQFLSSNGLACERCANMTDLVHRLREGCAALVLAEEALDTHSVHLLNSALAEQPSWSDLPITLITSYGQTGEKILHRRKVFAHAANVTVLERPFHPATLVSTMDVAMRSRRRQYQIRDLLKERADHLKDLEARVEARTAELHELNAHLESLVYTVAHDLRTPLRGIQGYSKLLLDDCRPGLNENGTRYIQRIQSAAERMDALVIDLMAYGRIARAQIDLTTLNLEEPWAAALAQCEPLIERTGATIETRRPLPLVCAHLTTLTQVLANLVINALTFVASGVSPRVRFYAVERGDFVRAWIEDNGVGIAPEHHDRIFRVFERIATVQQPGTGIGLSIVRKGVERMRGNVGVESAIGQGARFWIDLLKPRS